MNPWYWWSPWFKLWMPKQVEQVPQVAVIFVVVRVDG